MRSVMTAAFAAIIFASSASLAQTTQPASPATTNSTSGPGNSAVKDPDPKMTAAPVEGANSFTENQARSRIESQGFANVTGLVKGDDGVWRGKATRSGANVEVALDFKGNVTTK